MDWVDRPQNYKGLYGILQLLQGSHLDHFPLKTLKLGWLAFYSLTFKLKCLDIQSNQYKKLTPVFSRFCDGLFLGFLVFPFQNEFDLQENEPIGRNHFHMNGLADLF